MKTLEIKVHEIAEDGLPEKDQDGSLLNTGCVAFIWDGAMVTGWPIGYNHGGVTYDMVLWEASEDRMGGPYYGVTHWVELPMPAWEMVR